MILLIEKTFETVKKVLDDHKITYEIKSNDAESKVIDTMFHLEKNYNVSLLIMVYPTTVCISSVFPVAVKAKTRPDIAELLMRINSRLKIGNFNMDYDTGIVIYSSGERVWNEYTEEMFATSLYGVMEMSRIICGGPLEKVIEGDWAPVQGYEAFIRAGEESGGSVETDKEE